MTPNSAYELVPIVLNHDYSVEQNPIYALLCTKSSGVAPVAMRALGNNSDVTFTADVFKVGVVYYIYLKTLTLDGGGTVEFVGYRYANRPMVL